MAGKMKKFNIRGMLDGLRQSVGSSSPKSETEIEENIRSEDIQVAKVWQWFLIDSGCHCNPIMFSSIFFSFMSYVFAGVISLHHNSFQIILHFYDFRKI